MQNLRRQKYSTRRKAALRLSGKSVQDNVSNVQIGAGNNTETMNNSTETMKNPHMLSVMKERCIIVTDRYSREIWKGKSAFSGLIMWMTVQMKTRMKATKLDLVVEMQIVLAPRKITKNEVSTGNATIRNTWPVNIRSLVL